MLCCTCFAVRERTHMQPEARRERALLFGRLLTGTPLVATVIVVCATTQYSGELPGSRVHGSHYAKQNGDSTEDTEAQFLLDALHSASGSLDEPGLRVALDFAKRFMPNRKLCEPDLESSSPSSTSTEEGQSLSRTTPIASREFPEGSPPDRVSEDRRSY